MVGNAVTSYWSNDVCDESTEKVFAQASLLDDAFNDVLSKTKSNLYDKVRTSKINAFFSTWIPRTTYIMKLRNRHGALAMLLWEYGESAVPFVTNP